MLATILLAKWRPLPNSYFKSDLPIGLHIYLTLEQGSRYPVSFSDWVLIKYDTNIKQDI